MNYHVVLKQERQQALKFGHPWVFSRAILKVDTEVKDGDVVTVVSVKGEVLGTAYYNSKSQIALRFFEFGKQVLLDSRYFVDKFKQLQLLREDFIDLKQTNAYRLVFGESDGLPGLIVDRYGDFIVIQLHTLGIDKLRNVIVEALLEVFGPTGIYERSDVDVRHKEGLVDLPKQVLAGVEPPELYEIKEHGLKFLVDLKNGQKTGFFLDQRENRYALKELAQGRAVLNLFSYSGGFSVAALSGGAKFVTSVDISAPAVDLAHKNVELNGFLPTQAEFVVANVFDFLENAVKKQQKFDVIVVDPPAFVKNKNSLSAGVNAYISLNTLALKCLNEGGILVSSSCSSLVSQDLFRTILFKASRQAGRDLVLIENKIQPIDHPLNLLFPEGEYLKFMILKAR